MTFCLSVWVCDSYVAHHPVGTGLCCAPQTCVVHHRAALSTMVRKGDVFYPSHYLCKGIKSLYFDVAKLKRFTVLTKCKSASL